MDMITSMVGGAAKEAAEKAVEMAQEAYDTLVGELIELLPGYITCCCCCCSPSKTLDMMFSCCGCFIPEEAVDMKTKVDEAFESLQGCIAKVEELTGGDD